VQKLLALVAERMSEVDKACGSAEGGHLRDVSQLPGLTSIIYDSQKSTIYPRDVCQTDTDQSTPGNNRPGYDHFLSAAGRDRLGGPEKECRKLF
jgi:hypothetical protein